MAVLPLVYQVVYMYPSIPGILGKVVAILDITLACASDFIT